MKNKSKEWEQYSPEVVNMWDDFINWKKRKRGEGSFFVQTLKNYNIKNILDISCGTGYDSISLIKAGFKVKSCDGSPTLLKKAEENAKKEKITLDATQCDWRELINKFKDQKFDAIICLGNSLTHLFLERDRKSVINQIYFLLNKGGVLIIDQRNYDYILSKGYKSKHKYVYCGENIEVSVVQKDNSLIKMKYQKKGNGSFILDMYPIRIKEMISLLNSAGFEEISTYGDFQKNFDPDNTDFIQHIAIK